MLFDGMLHYEPLLNTTFEQYMLQHKEIVPRERSEYNCVSYISLFLLERLGMKFFKGLLSTSTIAPDRLDTFLLEFLFNEANFKSTLYTAYCKLYDHNWLNNVLLVYIRQWREKLVKLIRHSSNAATPTASATNKSGAPSQASSTTTIVKPFNITKPKPKRLPFPFLIEHGKVIQKREIPQSTFQCDPITRKALDKMKFEGKIVAMLDDDTLQKNRDIMKKKYENAASPFVRMEQYATRLHNQQQVGGIDTLDTNAENHESNSNEAVAAAPEQQLQQQVAAQVPEEHTAAAAVSSTKTSPRQQPKVAEATRTAATSKK